MSMKFFITMARKQAKRVASRQSPFLAHVRPGVSIPSPACRQCLNIAANRVTWHPRSRWLAVRIGRWRGRDVNSCCYHLYEWHLNQRGMRRRPWSKLHTLFRLRGRLSEKSKCVIHRDLVITKFQIEQHIEIAKQVSVCVYINHHKDYKMWNHSLYSLYWLILYISLLTCFQKCGLKFKNAFDWKVLSACQWSRASGFANYLAWKDGNRRSGFWRHNNHPVLSAVAKSLRCVTAAEPTLQVPETTATRTIKFSKMLRLTTDDFYFKVSKSVVWEKGLQNQGVLLQLGVHLISNTSHPHEF